VPTVHAGLVEDAVLETLKTWIYTELLELQSDGRLPAPRTWRVVNELTADLGPHQMPAVLLASAGLDGEPVRHAEGDYQAAWLLGIAVAVSAIDHERTIRLARLYSAAIVNALIRRQTSADWEIGVEWVDESYDQGSPELEYHMAIGYVTVRVHVDGARNAWEGRAHPVPEPEPDGTVPPPPADALPLTDDGIHVVVTPQ
jgi:hypothetical protein